MTHQNDADVIIVGAGPAGCACAMELSKTNKKVVVIERGAFAGSKNMFGGTIFSNVVEKIYPDFLAEAPLERVITKHNYVLMADKSSVALSYNNYQALENENKAIVVNRAKFDRWCAQKAIDNGVYFAFDTVVRELLQENGRVIGVKTDYEDFYAPLVIIAEGANALLTQQIGLIKKTTPDDEILSVKEVFEFESEEVLNQKLSLKNNEGLVYEFLGGPLKNKFALGILYTNKKSVSIGLGVSMKDLISNKKKPYELLDELKQTKEVANLLEGAKSVEYSAHLIPESSPKSLPKLYANGVLVLGDAAKLVNNLHFEGTNLAMTSGVIAAQTAIYAFSKNDFSKKTLQKYEKDLKQSFVYKDIKTYKNVMKVLRNDSDTFMGYYLDKVNEFFKAFVEADSIDKKTKYRKFICEFLKGINPVRLIKDGVNVIKLVVEALF